jgi:hypothetical protein
MLLPFMATHWLHEPHKVFQTAVGTELKNIDNEDCFGQYNIAHSHIESDMKNEQSTRLNIVWPW